MTQEKKEWLEKMANVIDNLKTRYCYSQACVYVEEGNDFYDDSCNYVNLILELDQLVGSLRACVKYSEMAEHNPKKSNDVLYDLCPRRDGVHGEDTRRMGNLDE